MKTQEHNNSPLDNIGREPVFRVPDNYFDTFPDRLMQKINTQSLQNPAKPNRTVLRTLMPYIALAASFVLLVGIWRLLLALSGPDNTNLISGMLDTTITTLESNNTNDIEALDDFTIAEILTDEALDGTIDDFVDPETEEFLTIALADNVDLIMDDISTETADISATENGDFLIDYLIDQEGITEDIIFEEL